MSLAFPLKRSSPTLCEMTENPSDGRARGAPTTRSGQLRLRSTALQRREVEGEVIALDGVHSRYLAANGSAALLWHKLAVGTTLDQLVDCMIDTYGIDRDRAAEDVESFLAELDAEQLLEA